MRSERPRDRPAAIAAWFAIEERYGHSSEIDEKLLPLLEAEGRFVDVANLLERRAAAASPADREALNMRLAELRLSRLGDHAGALAAFSEVLRQKPDEPTARAALERLLASGDVRLEAADVLEPIYRKESATAGLVKVLEARAELGAGDAVFVALREALSLAEVVLQSPEQALELAGWGLERSVTMGTRVAEWHAEVDRLGATSGQWRAIFLADALGERAIDTPELFELAQAAGAALSASGDLSRAVEIYRRALAYAPSSRELMAKVDELLAQQGAPEERLGLYHAALNEEKDPARRRQLLHSMATLQDRELGDRAAAVATWVAAVEEDPKDLTAHDALVALLTDLADWEGLYRELSRALGQAEGERRHVLLLRLGEVAALRNDPYGALQHYRELLERSDLADDVLDAIEHLARECNDGPVARLALERRLGHAPDPALRSVLLERLGNVLSWTLNDPGSASLVWLEGARICEAQGNDPERALKLYERVLDADPTSREAAERLVELLAQAGDWQRLEEVFSVLVGLTGERDVMMLLFGLEERAAAAGRLDAFIRLLDAAIARVGAGRSRHLLLAKARALGAVPGRAEEAVKLYRTVIEQAGEDATADAEQFGTFLRTTTPTPERAADFRWLYEWRVRHSASPVDVLAEWAAIEETRLGDAARAADLYARIVEIDPERIDALSELARLELALGRSDRAYSALEALKARAEGEAKYAASLKLAALLVHPLGRPAEALEAVAPVLEANPSDLDAIRIVHQTLEAPECRARAAELLEKIAAVSDNRVQGADVIEALLAVSAEAPQLAKARTRWLSQLLKSKTDKPAEALRLALQGAESAPEEDELWDVAVAMARRLNEPGNVAVAFERAMERELPPELAERLGQRMVEFIEEWFDDPDSVMRVLERVLVLAPSATWAFDRLKLAFNSGARWQELFSLYDVRLGAGLDKAQKLELLREAAMAAKDFASDAERAISYLEQLNALSPGDGRVETSLERLYERHGRTRPLIELLSARLESVKKTEKAELTGRIAALWLDLEEPGPAFVLASDLLAQKGAKEAGAALLERILPMAVASTTLSSDGATSVLEGAAKLLEKYYRGKKSTVDVVRMLEIEITCTPDAERRGALLNEVVELRLDTLGDAEGAFETLAQLVTLDPKSDHRKRFGDLAERLKAHDRRADTLEAVAASSTSPAVRAEVLLEAAFVRDRELKAGERAAALFREVVALREHQQEAALAAGRRLSEMLRDAKADPELVGLLEILGALEPELAARRAALGEAADRALSALGDAARAVRDYRARLALDDQDAEALDGLCRALESAERWDELVASLEARATLTKDKQKARADRVQIARIRSEKQNDLPGAIEAWRRVQSVHGADPESFEALSELLAASGLFPDLTLLLSEEVAREKDPERKAALRRSLGEVQEQRLDAPLDALDSYAAAGDWSSAVRVGGSRHDDSALEIRVLERLVTLAVEAWTKGGGEFPERTADWAIAELAQRLLEVGRAPEVIDRLLSASELPFPLPRKRELRRGAAVLCSDRVNNGERAIELFQALLEEDPADDVGSSVVQRLATLLEERDRHAELTDLWEKQAVARAKGEDRAGAAALWTRAASIAEERLKDRDRALSDYRNGAQLDSEESLEALARLYDATGDPKRCAEALERLCSLSSAETLAARALRLADVYAANGQKQRAREALERSVPLSIDASALRKRLGELYRESRDFTALAELLGEEARRSVDPAEKLGYLREAATIHVSQRKDPAAAVPLLELASELDPDDAKLRVDLALSLHACSRFDAAAAVLREQIQRYGARRPKDRAGVHYELARVLLAGGHEPDALAELEIASKIDPTHPGITQLLANVAFRQGELDRAERMYRALLLTAGKDESGPGRTDALVALADIAARRGDTGRADEFIESAFESAIENPREASLLEEALRGGGRVKELMKLLDIRLAGSLETEEWARIVGELAVLHRDAGDLAKHKTTLYQRAKAALQELERTDSLEDASWAALGRAFDAMDDPASAARVIERRIALSGRSSRPPADPDLVYRLAAARLADPETREQGIGLLERAFDLELDAERAAKLLEGIPAEAERDPRVAGLKERLARASGDQKGLARALAVRAGLSDATMATVREGFELAQTLGEKALAVELARAALSNKAIELGAHERGALRLDLAALYEAEGDLASAFDLREEAAPDLGPADGRALLLDLAARAEGLEEHERALRVYAKVLDDEPAEPRALGPALALYRKLGKKKEWLARVEHAIALVETVEERSALRLEQAQALLEQKGGERKAIEVLEELVLDDPGRREASELLAKLYEKAGRHDDLARLLGADLDAAAERGDHETSAAVGIRLTEILEKAGKVDEAADVARRALAGAPDNRDLAATVLRLAESTGDTRSIADALERLLAVERGPDAAELGRRLASLREELGDAKGVERALELACIASPDDAELLESLLSRFEARGDVERAASLLSRALERRPDDLALLERLSSALGQAGDHEEAARMLDRLVAAQPNDPGLLTKRAQVLRELGREDHALVDLEAAYALDGSLAGELVQALERAVARADPPEDLRYALRLVDVLEAGGDLAGARARLAEFLTHKPDDLAGFRRLASLDQRLGHKQEALLTLERIAALETGSGLVEVALAFSDAATEADDPTLARPALERALEMEPEHPGLLEKLESIYLSMGAAKELGEMLLQQAALIDDPNRRLAIVLRAAEALLSDNGDRDTAIRVLEVARSEVPASIEAATLLARAYAAAGQAERGLDVLKGVAAAQKGKRTRAVAAVYEQIAAIHLDEGFVSDALEAFSKAFEADPKNAELALTLGRLALDIDEDDVAQRAFRAVTIMRPKGPEGGARPEDKAEASYHLAALSKKQGDVRKARVLVSKALADDPDHAGARALLAELDGR
jgi:tetratricopeptide (TPR) repeat protein